MIKCKTKGVWAIHIQYKHSAGSLIGQNTLTVEPIHPLLALHHADLIICLSDIIMYLFITVSSDVQWYSYCNSHTHLILYYIIVT